MGKGMTVADPNIYLDHNATTPMTGEAMKAVADALGVTGNPSSVHQAGRQARSILENAREDIASAVGGVPSNVVFTSGGTEANALALMQSGASRLIVSAIEHDSVLASAAASGLPHELLPVNNRGIVMLDALSSLLNADAAGTLVSVMMANNETGVLQPVPEIVKIAHKAGALVHCDAVQAFGKVALDFADLGLDFMSISAHKLGGPKGCGALLIKEGCDVVPLAPGGGQEQSKRTGTENLAGIAGFAAVARQEPDRLKKMRDVEALRNHLEQQIINITPGALVLGMDSPRVANTSCLVMPGVSSETQLMHFDLAGICISAGSACSSGKVSASHVLAAMGLADDLATCAIRISLGPETTAAEIDRFLEEWSVLADRSVQQKVG